MRDIVFIGTINISGYSKLFRSFIDNIDSNSFYLYPMETIGSGINYDKYNNNIDFSINDLDDNSKFIYFSWPVPHQNIYNKFNHKSKVNFLYTMVESYTLDEDYFKSLNSYYSKFIVPNEFQYNMFSKMYGEDNVMTIHHPIDREFYNINIPKRQTCKFIRIDTNKFEVRHVNKIYEDFVFVDSCNFYYRKGIDIAIKSFLKSFSNESVALGLFIKPFYNNKNSTLDIILNIIVNEKNKINGHTLPIYLCEEWFSEEMSYIPYGWGNCFLYPTRGEGIGLPVLEAASCGLPIICSLASSMSSYFDINTAFVVDIDKTSNIGYMLDNKFYMGKFPKWRNELIIKYQYNCEFAIMDSQKIIDDFVDRMKFVYYNNGSDIVNSKIKNMFNVLENKFNTQNNVNKLLDFIKNV